MSHNNPPVPSTIFNSSNFTSTDINGQGGSPIPSPGHYVEFPVAQGANTLISTVIQNSLTVGGISQFNNDVDINTKLIFSDLTQQSTAGITLNQILTNTLPYTATQTFNNTITANQLITGTITTAQNSTNSTNATNINISDVGAGTGTFYPTFSAGNIGNNSLRTDSTNLRYNAGTDTLISTNFQGTATTATQITLQDQTLNTSNFPLVFSSNYTGASVTATSSNLFYKPSTNTLTTNLNGNATTSTTATTATNATNATNVSVIGGVVNNASYYLPFVNNTVTGNYQLNSNANISYNPSTTTLTTGTIISSLLRTTPNGTIRIYDTGGVSFSTLSQSGIRFINSLPNSGEFFVTTTGQGTLPGSNNSNTGTSILWNVSNGGGESVLLNYQASGTIGGFNFYNVSGTSSAVKIAGITKSQPASNDSSNNLATTAWVQGAISNSGVALPYYNYKFYGISSNVLNQSFQNISIVIPAIQFTTANCNAPFPAVKIRFTYSLYDSAGIICYSNTGVLNIFPFNALAPAAFPSPTTPIYATATTGGVTGYNTSSFNITNGLVQSPSNAQPNFAYIYGYYDDGYPSTPFRLRWFWVSNQNGGQPSGFGGTSAWFNYLNYTYNGNGRFNVGFNTPAYNSSPSFQGVPGWNQNTTLNMNMLFELIDNDIPGATITFSSS